MRPLLVVLAAEVPATALVVHSTAALYVLLACLGFKSVWGG